MPREIVPLIRNRKAPYESGADFFSLIAYPDPLDKQERSRYWRALCRMTILMRAAKDEEWQLECQWARPLLFMDSEPEYSSTLKRGSKRLQERLATAYHILQPQLIELETGKPQTIESFLPTVGNMAILTAAFLGMEGDSSSTVKSRMWKPTKPVAHLALAWIKWRELWNKVGRDPNADHFLHFMFVPAYVKEVVLLSERTRLMVPKIKRFNIRDDELIRIKF